MATAGQEPAQDRLLLERYLDGAPLQDQSVVVGAPARRHRRHPLDGSIQCTWRESELVLVDLLLHSRGHKWAAFVLSGRCCGPSRLYPTPNQNLWANKQALKLARFAWAELGW